MANTLIIRYHRIGDALIVLPLIVSLATKYKDDTFTVLTNEKFKTFLEVIPPNVTFKYMVSKNSKGIFRGLSFSIRKRLFSIKMKSFAGSFDKIALLQYDIIEQNIHKDILNNKRNIKIAVTDESAFLSEERIVNRCNDGLTMTELHKETFARLGYTGLQSIFEPDKIKNRDASKLLQNMDIDTKKRLIAISPFSKEKAKIYPLDKMEKVTSHFCMNNEYQVLIFGGGVKEQRIANGWKEKYPALISLIDCISFHDETTIMAKCDVALTMDSANLHLARLLDIPIVSVWGATTPQNGYYTINPTKDAAIIKNPDCQPCSIFGNKPCSNPKIYDCLDIKPESIISHIEAILSK